MDREMKSLAPIQMNVPHVASVLERFSDVEPPYFNAETVADICGVPVTQLDCLNATPEIVKRGDCLFLMADPVICVAPMSGRWVKLAPGLSREVYQTDPNRQGLLLGSLKIPDLERVFKSESEAREHLETCEAAAIPARDTVDARAHLLIASGAKRIVLGMGLHQFVASRNPDPLDEDPTAPA